MAGGEQRRSGVAASRWAVAVAMAMVFSALVPTGARAATTVACENDGDDVVRVQAAVDAAGAGDTIALSGTCNFTNAPAHGGGLAGIARAAVGIGADGPAAGLTIQSAGAPQSATVLGSGSQTAFVVGPGGSGVTIRGLRFVNFARPVVVVGAAGVTIGAAGGVPSPAGNRILGGATMDSAILAVADDVPMTVALGRTGSSRSAVLSGGSLTDLTVAGNYVTYAPPGPPDTSGQRAVVAVDVRQARGGTVDGVEIASNAVGMFTSELGSFSQNGVRVEGLAAVPASSPPSMADYRIRDVEIRDNNLGRLEELDPARLDDEVDPRDANAGGRAAIVVIRAADFTVSGNRVKARLSATSTGGPSPGGGIVASDSSFGTIAGNGVLVLADPSTLTSDLGAIGVVQGIPALFGDPAPDQAATGVEVRDNTVGLPTTDTAVGAQRGLVLAGVDSVVVHGNDVRRSSDAALLLGPDVRGPGAVLAGGPGTLPRTVTASIACANSLDGTDDDPDEVLFGAATPASTRNAFPGGSDPARGGPDNGECTPTVRGEPNTVLAGEDLDISGTGWPGRPVEVSLVDRVGHRVTRTLIAGGQGGFATTLTSADLLAMADGRMTLVATSSDTRTGFSRASAPATIRKSTATVSSLAGTVALDDGGDGFTNGEEMFNGTVTARWTQPADPDVATAAVWFETAGGAVPPGCGPFTVAPAGAGSLGACGASLPEGPYVFKARWETGDGRFSPDVVSESSVKDTVSPAAPTIASPSEGATVHSNTVTFTGQAEPGSTTRVQSSNSRVLASGVANGAGQWTATATLASGDHRVFAVSRDVAGNPGAASSFRNFTVRGAPPDTTPPAPPVITAPAAGSPDNPRTTMVRGTVEAGATVLVYEGTTVIGGGVADAAGNWAAPSGFSSTGPHTVTATATDAAGNVSAPSAGHTFDVDALPPQPLITTANDRIFLPGDPVVVEGTASDDRSVTRVLVGYYTSLDGGSPVLLDEATCAGCPSGPAASVGWASEPEGLLPGIYYAVVFAGDRAGNFSQGPFIRIIKAE